MNTKNLALSAFGVGLLALFLTLGVLHHKRSGDPVPEPPAPPQAPQPTPEPPPPPPAVTRQEFEALRYDMTPEQAFEIIGCDPDDTHTEYDRGLSGYTSPSLTVWHTWENLDGSKVSLGFISDKLTGKIESDLP